MHAACVCPNILSRKVKCVEWPRRHSFTPVNYYSVCVLVCACVYKSIFCHLFIFIFFKLSLPFGIDVITAAPTGRHRGCSSRRASLSSDTFKATTFVRRDPRGSSTQRSPVSLSASFPTTSSTPLVNGLHMSRLPTAAIATLHEAAALRNQ